MANPCINNCTIKVYLLDILGSIPTIDVNDPPMFYVGSGKHFFHGDALILPFTQKVSFDVNGKAEISVMETETPDHKLNFFISIPETYSTRVIGFDSAIVPDQAECPLTQITIAKRFGLS